ncbi:LuxR C-terminal-related transcriptional regulator [Streptomyces sp. 8K308]|uniref:response regulator transcription factor n=1 Tax=Streptomyces sp. 8K308 TaxID=2530388 RepID=UPI001FB63BE8|nr:LuxR C-terminal-related transcriptional regulator [Streptomyces sp. 8K308]
MSGGGHPGCRWGPRPVPTRHSAAHGPDGHAGRRLRASPRRAGRPHPREREVALAIGRGRTNADITGELAMGLTTVKSHVSSILDTLGLESRTQIALLAHDVGLA